MMDPVTYLDVDSKTPSEVQNLEICGYKGPGFYHYDETWAFVHGPYKDEDEARVHLGKYLEHLG